jgi:hypothetical protein
LFVRGFNVENESHCLRETVGVISNINISVRGGKVAPVL